MNQYSLVYLKWHEIAALDSAKVTVLDVRNPDEATLGMLSNAINIPLDVLRDNLTNISKNKPAYVYCQVGVRCYLASQILVAHVFTVFNLSGGYKTYQATTYTSTSVEKMSHENNQGMHPKVSSLFTLDTCGLQCPSPMLKVKKTMDALQPGEKLVVLSSDLGFSNDIEAWCHQTGNTFLNWELNQGIVKTTLQKGKQQSLIKETLTRKLLTLQHSLARKSKLTF